MKMRFWQKTYIFTLALFLLFLNAGILSLTVYTYRRTVDTVETAVTAEQGYIAKSFERDYSDMNSSSSTASPSLLMRSYADHYKDNGIYLDFSEGGEVIYGSFKQDAGIGSDELGYIFYEGERHIAVSSTVCDGRYVMLYVKNVSSLDEEFRSLMLTYALTALCVSLSLGVILYFVLRRLSMPLEKLRKTTESIEQGDFTVTAEEKGNDEFTLLAKSFNSMLARINEQMDALELTAEKKQMLVDNMAHELRTPLTSIHGYAEILEKAATTEENRLLAARYIMSESERLQKISEILLDSAYIRENKPTMQPLELSSLMKDVASKLTKKADNVGVKLECRAEEMHISGNETLLSMLFYNLVENAVKACEGGGKVEIYSEGDATVCIRDNGKGMTDEQMKHITEPFYRTDKSRSRAEGGAGLGLALCNQIVESHGASMHFESAPGVGTKISVTFTSRI